MRFSRSYANLEKSIFVFSADEVIEALKKTLGEKIPESDYDGCWALEMADEDDTRKPSLRPKPFIELSWTNRVCFEEVAQQEGA